MNQTVFKDAKQIVSGLPLPTDQEQALVVEANTISKVLAVFHAVLELYRQASSRARSPTCCMRRHPSTPDKVLLGR